MSPPTEIVIRRCAVRVVRHGGWSWGPQPQRLTDQVIAALPSLIAGRLAELAHHDATDVEITEPVRVAVSLRLADLRAGRFDPVPQDAITVNLPPTPSLASRPAQSTTTRHPDETPLDHPPPVPAYTQPATLVQFLAGLSDRGALDDVLALLPLDTLEAWYQALAALPTGRTGAAAIPAAPPDRTPRRSSEQTSDVPALLAAVATPTATDRARQLRDTIATVAAWAGRAAAAGFYPPHDPAAEYPPHDPAAEPRSRSAQPPPESTAPRPRHTDASVRAAAAVDVASALPFLLLGPLSSTGYLPALGPALQAVGLERETTAFATALAYTVLGPLARGWRRQADDVAAAAAFAGLDAPAPGPALAEFARVAAPALPALDAVVTRTLAEGHTSGEPLVLVGVEDRDGGGLLLVDREGLFPVAWTDTLAGILAAWRMCGKPTILVAPTAAGALRGLAAGNARFVVAAPPARGERWRQLPPHRLWTNDHSDPALARYAGGYQQVVEQAAELVHALAADRAAVPLTAGPALGRSLLLAAGLGLGTLAWTLWREREPTDPMLALERFADLSARVNFEPHRVRVQLPLGDRRADLSEHGLLTDVRGVPWLGDRVVEFSGG
jgi:hypothetical protein